MKEQLTIKYATKFENNQFSYSNKFDLFNIIDLKKLHDIFKSNKYITNFVVIEKIIDNKTEILYRLINGEKKESSILYLDQEIESTSSDIIINSVFDINEIITNIVNFIEIFDKDKSYNIINEIINEYEEDIKTKKLSFF